MFLEKDDQLQARFTFKDFKEAFGFMVQVAFLAEQHGHHPDWSNVWNEVDIRLCTHDAGHRVTEKDWALARDIEALLG